MKQKNIPAQGKGFNQPKINQEDISSIDFSALVPVIPGKIGERETSTASARALHKALGVGRDFINWIKGRIKQYEFVEGIDYVIVENLTSPKRASSNCDQITPEQGKTSASDRPEVSYA